MSATRTDASSEALSRLVDVPDISYTGQYVDNFKEGDGSYKWEYNRSTQIYTGSFLKNNFHGKGFYKFDHPDKKFFYDGQLYANKFEGYGNIFYSNNEKFEGLFKNNYRFGPGIFTYPDGSQDVGMWKDDCLIRLSVILSSDDVPKLAKSNVGKIKLLKYKHIIPVCPKFNCAATELLTDLEIDERIKSNVKNFYNYDVRNPKSVFFDKKLFDDNFYTENDCLIEVAYPEGEFYGEGEEQYEKDNRTYRYNFICDEINLLNERIEQLELEKKYFLDQRMLCEICCYPPEEEYTVVNNDDTSITTVGLMQSTREPSHSLFSGLSDLPSLGLDTNTYVTELSDNIEMEYPGEVDEPLGSMVYIKFCHCDFHEDWNKHLDTIYNEEQLIKNIIEYLKTRLYKEFGANREYQKIPTKKLLINELISTSNQPIYTSVLRHIFLNRKSENIVSFNVCNLITGKVQERRKGRYELKNIKFLNFCSSGTGNEILDIYVNSNINPDICDNHGNSGVIFASAKDNCEVIEVLATLGCNLDYCNDEGISALNMCLLRYLSIVYKVSLWEAAFLDSVNLDENEKKDVNTWCPHKSLSSLSSYKESEENLHFPKSDDNIKIVSNDDYIFRTDLVPRLRTEKVKSGTGKGKNSESSKEQPPIENTVSDLFKKLPQIIRTIKCLIESGADPNVCDVPIPTIFLATFSRSPHLVAFILPHVDAEATFTKYCLSPLHVIACLKPCIENIKICGVLLQHIDPDKRASTNHWIERKRLIIGKDINDEEITDTGKNALHILCLRQDFHLDDCNYFMKMFLLLRQKLKRQGNYLGHTYLSLAVLSGNLKLIQAMLKTNAYNPNAVLNNNMGNINTLFILKRYKDYHPVEVAKEIMKFVVDCGGNPLYPIKDFENSIAFMEKEHEVIVIPKDKKDKNKIGKNDKKSKKTKSNKSKSTKKGKGKLTSEDILKNYLCELARETILKFHQVKLIKEFYNLAEEGILEQPMFKYLSQFITPSIAHQNLKSLFQNATIPFERFDKLVCIDLIKFIERNQKKEKKKKGKGKEGGKKEEKDKKSKKGKASKTSLKTPTSITINWNEVVREIDFKPITNQINQYKIIEYGLHPSEIKDEQLYKVCFNCLKGRDKQLLACPKCELVFFCSENCNKEANKLNTFHNCKQVFYNKIKKKLTTLKSNEQELASVGIFEKAQLNCDDRYVNLMVKKQLEAKELERIRNNNDPYGLNRLRNEQNQENKHRRSVCFLTSELNPSMIFKMVNLIHTKYSDKNIVEAQHESHEIPKITTNVQCSTSENEKTWKETQNLKFPPNNLSWVSSTKLDVFPDVVLNSMKKKNCNPKTCEKRPCSGDVAKKKEIYDVKKYFDQMSTKKQANQLTNVDHTVNFLKRITRLPEKYQYFVELLARYFPDLDISQLFVPYACYSGGQLFYKFLEGDVFAQTYSAI